MHMVATASVVLLHAYTHSRERFSTSACCLIGSESQVWVSCLGKTTVIAFKLSVVISQSLAPTFINDNFVRDARDPRATAKAT